MTPKNEEKDALDKDDRRVSQCFGAAAEPAKNNLNHSA
jgi:hypothetical protein